eukprot:5516646-Prymnesium_polylepis.1
MAFLLVGSAAALLPPPSATRLCIAQGHGSVHHLHHLSQRRPIRLRTELLVPPLERAQLEGDGLQSWKLGRWPKQPCARRAAVSRMCAEDARPDPGDGALQPPERAGGLLSGGPIPLPPGLELTEEEASELAAEVRQENAKMKDEIEPTEVQEMPSAIEALARYVEEREMVVSDERPRAGAGADGYGIFDDFGAVGPDGRYAQPEDGGPRWKLGGRSPYETLWQREMGSSLNSTQAALPVSPRPRPPARAPRRAAFVFLRAKTLERIPGRSPLVVPQVSRRGCRPAPLRWIYETSVRHDSPFGSSTREPPAFKDSTNVVGSALFADACEPNRHGGRRPAPETCSGALGGVARQWLALPRPCGSPLAVHGCARPPSLPSAPSLAPSQRRAVVTSNRRAVPRAARRRSRRVAQGDATDADERLALLDGRVHGGAAAVAAAVRVDGPHALDPRRGLGARLAAGGLLGLGQPSRRKVQPPARVALQRVVRPNAALRPDDQSPAP